MPHFFDPDLVRGWDAAERGGPFDEFESEGWVRGWRLWHIREACRRVHAARAQAASVH